MFSFFIHIRKRGSFAVMSQGSTRSGRRTSCFNSPTVSLEANRFYRFDTSGGRSDSSACFAILASSYLGPTSNFPKTRPNSAKCLSSHTASSSSAFASTSVTTGSRSAETSRDGFALAFQGRCRLRRPGMLIIIGRTCFLIRRKRYRPN